MEKRSSDILDKAFNSIIEAGGDVQVLEELPIASVADAGKVLGVNEEGKWAKVDPPSGEGEAPIFRVGVIGTLPDSSAPENVTIDKTMSEIIEKYRAGYEVVFSYESGRYLFRINQVIINNGNISEFRAVCFSSFGMEGADVYILNVSQYYSVLVFKVIAIK